MTTLPTDLKTTFTSHANLIKTVNILDVSKPDSVPVSQDVAVLRSRHYSGNTEAVAHSVKPVRLRCVNRSASIPLYCAQDYTPKRGCMEQYPPRSQVF
jgi:hypothetical protein